MNLLILSGPQNPNGNPNLEYRGTYRSGPSYADWLPKDHEFNRLFMWFIQEGGELGIVNNLSLASKFAKLCNLYLAPRKFEVIEATEANTPPRLAGAFLGFDISQAYNNSLLWWGLKLNPRKSDTPISILSSVVGKYFAPQLNAHGLFQKLDAALFCRDALIALQSFQPNLLEGDTLDKFQVTGIYRVSLDSEQ